MRRTCFKFDLTFLIDSTDELSKKLSSIRGVKKVKIVRSGSNPDAELTIDVEFDNSETAMKLHRKIMNLLIKSKDSIIVRKTKTILTDIF